MAGLQLHRRTLAAAAPVVVAPPPSTNTSFLKNPRFQTSLPVAGEWEFGQGGVGWYYDAARKWVVNDANYTDTMYFYQRFPALANTKNVLVIIDVEPHPSGQPNGGYYTLILGGINRTMPTAPGHYEFIYSTADTASAEGFFLLPNGAIRIAFSRVDAQFIN